MRLRVLGVRGPAGEFLLCQDPPLPVVAQLVKSQQLRQVDHHEFVANLKLHGEFEAIWTNIARPSLNPSTKTRAVQQNEADEQSLSF